MRKRISERKAAWNVVLSALIYGVTPVLCAFTYALGNSALTLVFFRQAFIVPVLGVMIALHPVDMRLRGQEAVRLLFISFFGTALTPALLCLSYGMIGTGTATTLHFLYPLFVLLICHLRYHDPLSRRQVMALLLSLAGIACFTDPGRGGGLTGVLLALASGLMFSLYLVGLDKSGFAGMDSRKLSFYLSLFSIGFLAVINLAAGGLRLAQPPLSFGIMFLISFLAQYVGVALLQSGIAVIGSPRASLLSMLEPVSCLLFSALFLDEKITLLKLLGAALIVTAILAAAAAPVRPEG